MTKYKVAYFGTPAFSVSSLRVLAEHPQIEIVSVISMPDRPAGRGKQLKSPEVITCARELNLPHFQTENVNRESSLRELLKNCDFFVVLAFAQFLSESFLQIPRLGAFNIHTSLLPKYRGAAPIQYALLNGDRETGVSIQKMVKKMDAGDIVWNRLVAISSQDTGDSLFQKLEKEAAFALKDFLDQVTTNEDALIYEKQDESLVTFAPTIKKQDGLMNPLKETATDLHNKARAFYSWPGTFIYFNDFRLKILATEIVSESLAPGIVSVQFGTLNIGTKSGTLRLKTIQLEGKKPTDDGPFINGLKNKNIKLTLNRDHYE